MLGGLPERRSRSGTVDSQGGGFSLEVTTLLFVFALFIAGNLFRYTIYAVSFQDTDFSHYVSAICAWDCASYTDVAEGGYDAAPGHGQYPGRANWAFFPLFPAVIAGFRALTGASLELSGYVISNIATLAAAFAARPLFGENQRAYWLYVFFLFLGPFAVLISTVHTESIFVLLTILGLVALQQGRYVRAGVWSALLSATRVTGVLFVFALVTQAIIDQRRAGFGWRALPARLLGDPKVLLGVLIAPLGLIVYMAYLRFSVGDGLSFARVQISWERELGNPVALLWGALFPQLPVTPPAAIGMAWAWGGVAGLLLCGVLALQRQYAAAVFCTLALLVSMSAGVTSMLRFTAGLAPLGFALAVLLSGWRPLYYLTFPATIAAAVPVTVGWYRYSWLLM